MTTGPEVPPLSAAERAVLREEMRKLSILGNVVESFTYQTVMRCLVTMDAQDAEIAKGEAAYWELDAGLTARIGELETKLQEAMKFIVYAIVQPKQPDVVGGSYPLATCPIYGGRPRGWSCIDDQRSALVPTNKYGDELRAALIAGEGLCLRCRASQTLAALQSA